MVGTADSVICVEEVVSGIIASVVVVVVVVAATMVTSSNMDVSAMAMEVANVHPIITVDTTCTVCSIQTGVFHASMDVFCFVRDSSIIRLVVMGDDDAFDDVTKDTLVVWKPATIVVVVVVMTMIVGSSSTTGTSNTILIVEYIFWMGCFSMSLVECKKNNYKMYCSNKLVYRNQYIS